MIASPLLCEPLAMVSPFGPKEFVTGYSLEPFLWVKQRYRGFCKLVGFPFENHEQECLALLQCIEADRFVKKEKVGSRQNPAFGVKGYREV